jgi:hypothetical protein
MHLVTLAPAKFSQKEKRKKKLSLQAASADYKMTFSPRQKEMLAAEKKL